MQEAQSKASLHEDLANMKPTALIMEIAAHTGGKAYMHDTRGGPKLNRKGAWWGTWGSANQAKLI
jgi:hypothetical protein